MRGLWGSLALAFSLTSRAFANPEPSVELVERQSASTNASTYVYSGYGYGNFTFTITVNPDNNDMWFRMSAPAQYSWIGVAAGSQMKDAKVFFMAYQGSKDNSLTISARGPCDDCEPGYVKGFGLNSAVTPSGDPAPYGISNDTYFVSGFVANGTRRAGIDPTKKNQPFMFAIGSPFYAPRSDSFDAPLRMHQLHGNFQLDMTAAHGIKLPALGTKEAGVAAQGTATRDHDVGSPAHAALMGFGFVLILPAGILALRVLNRVKLHAIVQGIGLLFITIGWITGFVISGKYQRSMNYNNPHQIIGILVYILLLAQWATGFFHHRIYQKTQQPTWMIKPHKLGLGMVVLALGIINMALGFRFANAARYNLFFVPIVIGVIIVMAIAISLKRVLHTRRNKPNVPFGGPVGSAVQPPQPYGAAQQQYGAPQGGFGATFGSRSDVELGKMGPPPAYNGQATAPREML